MVAVRTALQAAGIDYDSAEVQFVATMDIPVGEVDVAGKVFRLVDAVDDLDDVQNVYSNADIPDEVLEAIERSEDAPANSLMVVERAARPSP